MADLFEKVELFYSLATTGDRKSIFNKLANPELSITPEVLAAVQQLSGQLQSEYPEVASLLSKNVLASNSLQVVKQNLQALAAAATGNHEKVYTDAVTVLTQVNREIRAQNEKRK